MNVNIMMNLKSEQEMKEKYEQLIEKTPESRHY